MGRTPREKAAPEGLEQQQAGALGRVHGGEYIQDQDPLEETGNSTATHKVGNLIAMHLGF